VARKLPTWAGLWLQERGIPRGEQGVYRRMSTWYDDEGLLVHIRSIIAGMGERLTSQRLAREVEKYLLSDEHEQVELEDIRELEEIVVEGEEDSGNRAAKYRRKSIRARSARRWLRQLGFQKKDVRKGIYYDGHERIDVIEYRKQFLEWLEQLKPYLIQYDELGNSISHPPQPQSKILIPCMHDESTFNANDGRHQSWHSKDQVHLRKNISKRSICSGRIGIASRGRKSVWSILSAQPALRWP